MEYEMKSHLKQQPNLIKIKQRLFEIKRNQKKMPRIDFNLRLDAYHADDRCLHCRKNPLGEFMFQDSLKQPALGLR